MREKLITIGNVDRHLIKGKAKIINIYTVPAP